MTNHFPPSSLGAMIIGADQLDLLLWMTLAASNFSVSSFTTDNFSWQWDKASGIQDWNFQCQLSFLLRESSQ